MGCRALVQGRSCGPEAGGAPAVQESRCCPYPMMRALASLFLSASCAILVCSTWLALNYLGLLGALGHQRRIVRWDRTCWVTYGTASKAGGS